MRALALLGFWASLSAAAQGGVRLVLWNYEPVLKYGSGVELDTHLGLGYDHDLEKRLSYGVQLRYALEAGSFVLTYHSAFHFSDNDNGSFYLGPIVGLRRFGSLENAVVVPVGLRMGVRGGLERFYADLHVGGQYNMGGGSINADIGNGGYDLLKGTFCFGLDLAWGWEKNSRH